VRNSRRGGRAGRQWPRDGTKYYQHFKARSLSFDHTVVDVADFASRRSGWPNDNPSTRRAGSALDRPALPRAPARGFGRSPGGGKVARSALAFRQPSAVRHPALVNGAAGVVVRKQGEPFAVMGFTVAHGKVVAIDCVVDPERLARLVSVLPVSSDDHRRLPSR
jgi:hypothetical protein